MQEISLRDKQLAEASKLLEKADKNMREFTRIFETARNERNTCGKDLMETAVKLNVNNLGSCRIVGVMREGGV